MRKVLVAFTMPYSTMVSSTIKLDDSDKLNFDTIGKKLETNLNIKEYSIFSWSEIEE